MEAVTAYAFLVEALGYRVVVRERAVAAMEGRIETSDLRQVRKARPNGTDRSEVVGLMQGRERNEALQARNHVVVDQDRPVIVRTAMDHAMTDCDGIELLRLAQPGSDLLHRGRKVGRVLHAIALVDQPCSVGSLGAQPRARSDAVHLALDQALEIAAPRGPEHLELDARRAGIGDQDRIHDVHAAGSAAMRRRASA